MKDWADAIRFHGGEEDLEEAPEADRQWRTCLSCHFGPDPGDKEGKTAVNIEYVFRIGKLIKLGLDALR